jgi:hypothetical protein
MGSVPIRFLSLSPITLRSPLSKYEAVIVFYFLIDSTFQNGDLPLNVTALLTRIILLMSVSCLALAAQDTDFHSCTFNAGGGFAPTVGKDRSSLNSGWNFHGGGGFAFSGPPKPGHAWVFLVTANFLFAELGISQSALQEARTMNTTNVGLLGATGGRAKFYTATVDPTFRFPVGERTEYYILGGYGWFRRSLEFTGTSVSGSLIQPSSPVVFGSGGSSGAIDAGGGVNFKLSHKTGGLKIYAEARVVHGLAINSSSTMLPLSAGIRW